MLAKCTIQVLLAVALFVAALTENGQADSLSYRLPTDVKPVNYVLTLAPFFYSDNPKDFYFTGSVKIVVEALNDTSTFKLHSYKLKVFSLRVRSSTGANIVVVAVKEDIKRQWLSVSLREVLQKGNKYTVLIDEFKGEIGVHNRGLYVSDYLEDETMHYVVASQLEATYARQVFPCFDEPAMKAQFEVSLVRSGDYSALSNMPRKSSTRLSKAVWFNNSLEPKVVFRDEFERTPIMSTYLLAFLVSKYNYTSLSDNKGRIFVNWMEPQLIKFTNASLFQASLSINTLENLINVPYEMKVTNQAGVPAMSGAMENWGLIIYGTKLLKYDKDLDTTDSLLESLHIISHEIAHQWFGNLVTMKWWNEVWLNEAFATFYSYLGMNTWTAVADLDSLFFVWTQSYIMKYEMQYKQNRSIQMDVWTPKEIEGMFDSITYEKGASVIRMIYNSIGDRVFGSGITNYIKRHSYSSAEAEDLYANLSEQTMNSKQGVDVGQVMRSWVKQAGFPLVTCTFKNGSLHLRQHEFGSQHNATNRTWIIPITAVTNLNNSQWNGSQLSHMVQWMSEKTLVLPMNASADWYLLNLRANGHYLVNYDKNNWKSLTTQLVRNHSVFTPVDRARLLYDSVMLAEDGIIDYDVPMSIVTEYLKKETELAPWTVFWKFWTFFSKTSITKTAKDIVKPVFEHVIRNPFRKSVLEKILFQLIVTKACTENFSYCKEYAMEQSIYSNSAESKLPDVRAAISTGQP